MNTQHSLITPDSTAGPTLDLVCTHNTSKTPQRGLSGFVELDLRSSNCLLCKRLELYNSSCTLVNSSGLAKRSLCKQFQLPSRIIAVTVYAHTQRGQLTCYLQAEYLLGSQAIMILAGFLRSLGVCVTHKTNAVSTSKITSHMTIRMIKYCSLYHSINGFISSL